jgi:hypothetical protein
MPTEIDLAPVDSPPGAAACRRLHAARCHHRLFDPNRATQFRPDRGQYRLAHAFVPACNPGRQIVIQWVRSVLPGVKPATTSQTRLDWAVLQRRPRASLYLQAGPSTLRFSCGQVMFSSF